MYVLWLIGASHKPAQCSIRCYQRSGDNGWDIFRILGACGLANVCTHIVACIVVKQGDILHIESGTVDTAVRVNISDCTAPF